MSKIEELTDINASYTGISKLNSHLAKIETAFQNTLSRDGSTPNHMLADIDMNSQQLINLGTPTLGHHAVTKSYLDAIAFDGSVDLALPGRIKFYNTYSDMQSESVDGGLEANAVFCTAGRSAAGDGGFGFWRVRSGSTTDNGGTAINHSSLSFYFERLHDGIFNVDWFGSEFGAAATAAVTAFPSVGGYLKTTPGKHYTATTQFAIPRTKNFYTIDMQGSRFTWSYTGGSPIKVGDGIAQTQGAVFIGYGSYMEQSVSATNALFEIRGLRNLYTLGLKGAGIYSLCKWGDPADAQSCYQWWHKDCEWNMNTTAHSHLINANGSAGGYYETDTYIEGVLANAATTAAFYLDINQGPARFDGMSRNGGIWKYFDYGVYAENARIVNFDWSSSVRTDDMKDWCFRVLVNSLGVKGGCEGINIRGTFSGGQQGGGVWLSNESGAAAAVIQNVSVSDVQTANLVEAFFKATTTGTGTMKQLHVHNNYLSDYNTSSNNVDCIVLDGDITESSVSGNTMDRKNGSSFTPRYLIYNNTASTKSIWITADNSTIDANTGVVYDPNIGDLSIKRFCALHGDGTPRKAYPLTFVQTNFAASQTDVAMESATGIGTFYRVPNRSRVTEISTSLNAAVAAGSLTIGYGVATIDPNLDIVHTSGTGSTVRYVSGSAALAAGDSVFVRYTTNAGVTLNIDGSATVWVQEM